MRYRDVDRALKAAGFVLVRTNGSHCFYANAKTGKRTVVPNHGTKDIALGTLKKIEKATGITLLK